MENVIPMPGYRNMVSLDGVVYGVLGKPLVPQLNKRNGYWYIKVRPVGGGCEIMPINVAVCIAHHGPKTIGLESRHLDGVKSNNHPSNLEWDTHKVNCNDRGKHGTSRLGSKHTPEARAKISAAQKAYWHGRRSEA